MDLRETCARHFASFSRFRVLLLLLCGSIAFFGCYLVYHQLSSGAAPGSSTFSLPLPGGEIASIQTGFVGLVLVVVSLGFLCLMLMGKPRVEVVAGDKKIILTHSSSPFDAFDQGSLDKMDANALNELQNLDKNHFDDAIRPQEQRHFVKELQCGGKARSLDYDHIRSDSELIVKVCSEEQIAFLEESRTFISILEATARALKQCCGIKHKKITIEDLSNIAQHLNAKLKVLPESDLPSVIDALLAIVKNKNGEMRAFIIVKEGISLRSAKFRIGHEIGHLVLGHLPLTINDARKSFRSFRQYIRNEFEANHIAGALLMGPNQYRRDLETTGYALDQLAEEYDVSYETAAHRAAIVADFIHFVKIDEHGKIVKRLFRSTKKVKWSAINRLCRLSGARKALESKDDPYMQVSYVVDKDGKELEKLFCLSRKVDKPAEAICQGEGNGVKKFVISVGCAYGNALRFNAFKEAKQAIKETKMSSMNCDGNCEISRALNLHNCD